MYPLRNFFLLTIGALLFGVGFAQTEYESPHVKDSTTIQLTFPSGYYEVVDTDQNVAQAFTTEKDLTLGDLSRALSTLPILMVMHLNDSDFTLEEILAKLETSFDSDENEITEIESPNISIINGREVVIAAAKGKIDGDFVEGLYMCAIHSGDYYLMIVYKGVKGIDNHLEYSEFKNIINSWREVATDKNTGVYFPSGIRSHEFVEYEREPVEGETRLVGPPAPPPPPVIEEEIEENTFEKILDEHYKNDLFQTQFTFRDVLPSLGENWSVPMTGNAHLLVEFVYNDDQGSVKIFSGGDDSDYSNTTEMGSAVQRLLGLEGSLEVKYDSMNSNGLHSFIKYTVSERERIPLFYIAYVNGEIIFFVVDKGSNPVDDFEAVVEEFMNSMWINFSIE